jgi:hypothetical protein
VRSLVFTVSDTETMFETPVGRLFRDGVQFCSGLVDLVVGVGHRGDRGHRLTLVGEGFVGIVAENIAQVGEGAMPPIGYSTVSFCNRFRVPCRHSCEADPRTRRPEKLGCPVGLKGVTTCPPAGLANRGPDVRPETTIVTAIGCSCVRFVLDH